jgi:hypothetical protein
LRHSLAHTGSRSRALTACAAAALAAALAPGTANAATTVVQGESLTRSATGTQIRSDRAASGGKTLALQTTGARGSASIKTAGADKLSVRVRGFSCSGAPRLVATVGGKQVMSVSVTQTAYTTKTAPVALGAGTHAVKVSFPNNLVKSSRCNRNLYVDYIKLSGNAAAPSPQPTPSPTPTPSPQPSPGPSGTVLWGTNFETGAFEAYKSTISKQGSGTRATRTITTEQARTGTKSMKIVLPPSSGTSRYQMKANMPNGGEGTDRYYGWSVRLGTDWAGSSCALTQLVDNGSFFMGQGGFRYTNTSANGPGANPGLDSHLPGRWSIGLNLTNSVGGDQDQQRDLGPICENQWKDIVFHVKWSSGSGGIFETWADGVKVGPTYHGKTMGYSGGSFEHRQGLYQGGGVNHQRTLYIDNDRVGTSYAAVDPSR